MTPACVELVPCAGSAPWAPSAVIDHASGFLAASPRNLRFEDPQLAGFVAYRRQGRHRIAFGGVHAPAAQRAGLLDAFLRDADAVSAPVAAVQVREDQVELFRSRGFVVNQLGSSFSLDLSGFSLAGAARLKLRNRIRRAERAGVVVSELGRDAPLSARIWRELDQVSGAWLESKRAGELDFMIGELGTPGDPWRRVFLAADSTGRILGFVTYVPAWGRQPGYLHDLTRRRPGSPPGVMEHINATALERFTAEGVAFLHFGFTPFIVDPVEPAGGHPGMARVIRWIARHGRLVYPARSQYDYKMKWAPDRVEREYVALRRPLAAAVWALLRVTRAVAWPRSRPRELAG